MRKFITTLLTVCVALGVLLSPTAAFAGDGVEFGGNVSGNGSGNKGSTPTPPSGGGGGSSTKPKPVVGPPAGTHWVVYTVDGVDRRCDVKADGRVNTSVTYRALMWEGGSRQVQPEQVGGQATYSRLCNYAPATSVVSRTVTCVTRSEGAIKGPDGVPGVTPGVIKTVSMVTPWAAGGKTAPTCDNNVTASINTTVSHDGYYDLNLSIFSQSCLWRSYTAGNQPDIQLSCGRETSSSIHKALTVSCSLPGGFSYGRVLVTSFGVDACRNTSPEYWSCNTAAVNYADQPAVPVLQPLDDGRQRMTVWQPMVVGGNVTGIRDVRTVIDVDDHGSPIRAGAPMNGDTQPQTISLTPGGPTLGLDFSLDGEVTQLAVGWQRSSQPGLSSTTSRTVQFTAEFPVASINISSVNLSTGAVAITSTVAQVTGTGSCESQPLVAQVIRASNGN